MKARHVCAVAGVALAVGTVTFMRGLVDANDHQSLAVAERLLEQVKVPDAAKVAAFALDFRPNGRVLQGPPMRVTLASGADAGLAKGEVVVTKALFAQRRAAVPPAGTELVLVGRNRVWRLRLKGVLDWERPLRGYPNAFVSSETAAEIDERWTPWAAKSAADLAPGFRSDAQRNLDRAKALLLWAAALTALCLLVNSLFLTIEAKRKDIAILRMVGATRGTVVARVFALSLSLASAGALLGTAGAWGALWGYVRLDPATFPMGMGPLSLRGGIFAAVVLVSLLAALLALKPALAVRPLEAASDRMPRHRPLGMLIAFSCGFGAFVAVEVWGASLMHSFVPSPEWPDAIVSILPGGVSAFDIGKLRADVKDVARLHELEPLQVNFESQTNRNALLLASDYLPPFRFVAGTRETALDQVGAGDNAIITEMMARARGLKLGDDLKLDCGRGLRASLKVVGIVDLNWHMVTSRALVRGLNRMPKDTDGPVFVSFDTLEACDPRPAAMVKMTHLWLDFRPDFLAAHGAFEAGRIVEREIAEALGLQTEEADGNTVRLHSRDEVADGTLSHGWDIIGSMARVPFVFILVISLGFVAMLVASADARRREFRVLRAVGATRWQLAGILAREAMKVALAGIALGLLGGALTGWLATGATRAAMANWGIPPAFAVPWLTLAKGAVGAIGFALLVAIPTASVKSWSPDKAKNLV